jgi:hypothetical protein|tara:strand:- start:141 stop:605 length:465 start_codon:yes stop_codon:yes gene_type:complete
MATVSTTFTFSSTDITSDALSFTVSENLALTGSGGIQRFNLSTATNSQSAYQVYNSQSFNATDPTYLYLKNITGSGYSASAGAMSTASYVHLYISGAGHSPVTQSISTVAVVPQGGFTYIPINPDNSYFIFAADHTGSEGNIAASTIVEFGVFN